MILHIQLVVLVLSIFTKIGHGGKTLCSHSKLDKACYCDVATSQVSHFPVVNADCSRLEYTKVPATTYFSETLYKLDLSHNLITDIDDFETKFTSDTLEILDLSYNKISYISDQFFQYIPNLRSLDLSHNELTSFENADVFYGLRQLTHLDLSFNKLKSFPDQLFSTMPKLYSLNIGYNNLGEHLMEVEDFGNSSCKVNPSLVELNMDNLGITELPNGFFESFQALKHLSLADNQFSEVPVVPYSVEYFDLSGNSLTYLAARNLNYHSLKTFVLNRLPFLTTVDHYAFYNLQSLEALYLNDCPKLIAFTDLAFGVLRKDVDLTLKKLSIARSGLQTLNYTYGYLFDELDYINLDNNPWKCDCKLMWMREYNMTLYKTGNIR